MIIDHPCGRLLKVAFVDEQVRCLEARKHILDLIDRRREAEGDSNIGASIERQIVAQELASLERDLIDSEYNTGMVRFPYEH